MTTIITPSQTCGPLFGFAILPPGIHQTVDENAPEAVIVSGALLDGEGRHLGFEAFLEFWSEGQACRVRTIEGRYRAVLKRPPPLPASAATAAQAPHVHIGVHGRGLTRHLVTRLYFSDEATANAADPTLALVEPARRRTLIAEALGEPRQYAFDIRLQGDGETVFLELER